jgi:spermidine synthase
LKKKNDRAITRVVIATGISSVVTQLLTIREFLAQFQGNEFVIALILFNWLILGGIGTLLARWITQRFWQITVTRLGWLSFLLAGLPAVQILAIRELRDILFIHGSSVGFYPTLAYTFLTIAPYCLLLGFVRPYSLFVLRTENPDYPGAWIYIIDNIGDVSGGAFFSFALVYLVTPLQAVFLSNLPLLAAAYLLFPRPFRNRFFVLACAGLTFIILVSAIFLEPASLAPVEGKLVHYRESRYGRIAVHQDQEQFTLFLGGTPLFSSQNQTMAEEAIHYPMAQLENAQHVLLISAEGGMMKELHKHRPVTVDYIELDPQVASVQFRFGLIKTIPGLNVIHKDGRAYLADSNKRYDAIIVNLTEPNTFQINRFFTRRFFALAKNHIPPHGVLSFSMQGFDNYLAEPQRQKLSSLYNTVKEHFNHVLLLPGQKIIFLCSDQPIQTDIPALLDKKDISTLYIKGYYYGNLTRERIERLNELIDPDTPKNRDDSPQLMRLMYTQWFAKFATSPAGFFAVLTVLLTIYMFRITREEFVLFSTGCMVMGCEVLVIFAFQIFFGYIYFQIGLIVTVFLAGLLPGAWLGDRLSSRGKIVLTLTDGLLIFFLIVFILILIPGADQLPVAYYLVFGFAVSVVCGFQFPVALYLRGGDDTAVARTFSADLLGAAFGTLATSVFLIPYFGIIWAAAGLIVLKLASLIVIGTSHEKNRPASFSIL